MMSFSMYRHIPTHVASVKKGHRLTYVYMYLFRSVKISDGAHYMLGSHVDSAVAFLPNIIVRLTGYKLTKIDGLTFLTITSCDECHEGSEKIGDPTYVTDGEKPNTRHAGVLGETHVTVVMNDITRRRTFHLTPRFVDDFNDDNYNRGEKPVLLVKSIRYPYDEDTPTQAGTMMRLSGDERSVSHLLATSNQRLVLTPGDVIEISEHDIDILYAGDRYGTPPALLIYKYDVIGHIDVKGPTTAEMPEPEDRVIVKSTPNPDEVDDDDDECMTIEDDDDNIQHKVGDITETRQRCVDRSGSTRNGKRKIEVVDEGDSGRKGDGRIDEMFKKTKKVRSSGRQKVDRVDSRRYAALPDDDIFDDEMSDKQTEQPPRPPLPTTAAASDSNVTPKGKKVTKLADMKAYETGVTICVVVSYRNHINSGGRAFHAKVFDDTETIDLDVSHRENVGPTFDMLLPGGRYRITGAGVYYDRYRKKRLELLDYAVIEPVTSIDDDAFHLKGVITRVRDLRELDGDDDTVVNVIGIVSRVGKLLEKITDRDNKVTWVEYDACDDDVDSFTGGYGCDVQTLRRVVTIFDDSKYEIDVTFWGQRAIDIERCVKVDDDVAFFGATCNIYGVEWRLTMKANAVLETRSSNDECRRLRDWYKVERMQKGRTGHYRRPLTLSPVADALMVRVFPGSTTMHVAFEGYIEKLDTQNMMYKVHIDCGKAVKVEEDTMCCNTCRRERLGKNDIEYRYKLVIQEVSDVAKNHGGDDEVHNTKIVIFHDLATELLGPLEVFSKMTGEQQDEILEAFQKRAYQFACVVRSTNSSKETNMSVSSLCPIDDDDAIDVRSDVMGVDGEV